MIQPNLFSEAVTPPVVTGPIGKRDRKNTQYFDHDAPKVTTRTAAHCRDLARTGKKAGCSPEWCESYNAEADAIDAANGLMPLRQAQAVTEDVAALGKSEWQKFLAADPRRVMG